MIGISDFITNITNSVELLDSQQPNTVGHTHLRVLNREMITDGIVSGDWVECV